MRLEGLALSAALALSTAAPTTATAGDLVIYEFSGVGNGGGAGRVLLPGAGKYLFEFSSTGTGVVWLDGGYEVDWDIFVGPPGAYTGYLDGNEQEVLSLSALLVGPKSTYLYEVPATQYYTGPVAEGYYGLPEGTIATYEEKYVDPYYLWLFENVSGVEGEEIPYSFKVTQLGAIPEPATWALMLAGFVGAGVALRRQRPPLFLVTR